MPEGNTPKNDGHEKFLAEHLEELGHENGAGLPGYADPDVGLPHFDAVPTDWGNGLLGERKRKPKK
jgi:hypothetical protein